MNLGKTVNHVRCFDLNDGKYKKRDINDTKLAYSFMGPKGNGIYKSRSILVDKYDTVISESISLDNLHQIYLGVEKRFLEFHFESKFHQQHFYIPQQKQMHLDTLLKQIKLPSMYHPLKKIKKLKYFKAEENRSLFHYAGRKYIE